MCGLAGIINLENITWSADVNKKVFNDLLIATSLRGKHSTGVFTVPHDEKEDICLIKKAVSASEFVQLDDYNNIMKNFNDCRYIIGHTRYATTGVISDANAHPFSYENILLIHNGSVNNKHQICQLSDKSGMDCDVDSESLAVALSKNSIEDFVKKIQGAFAIIWYDRETRKLNFIRNTERPLHFGIVTGSEKNIIFASEAEAIYFVAKRNGLELSRIFSLDVGALLTFNEDYSFDINKIYDGKKVAPAYTRYVHNSPYYNNYGTCTPYEYDRRFNKTTTVDDLFPEKDFKDIDMDKGDLVKFKLSNFREYSNKNRGTIEGVATEAPNYAVNVYNIAKASLPGGTYMVGKLSEVSTKKENKYILILDSTSIKSSLDYFYDDYDDTQDLGIQYMVGDEMVDLKTWYKKVENGCEVCQSPISCNEDYLTSWTDTGKPICKDCKHTGEFDSHIKVSSKQ